MTMDWITKLDSQTLLAIAGWIGFGFMAFAKFFFSRGKRQGEIVTHEQLKAVLQETQKSWMVILHSEVAGLHVADKSLAERFDRYETVHSQNMEKLHGKIDGLVNLLGETNENVAEIRGVLRGTGEEI